MKRFFALFLLSLASLPGFAQFDVNYKPLPFLDTITGTMDADLKEKLRLSKEACNERSTQVNTFLKSLYDKQHEYLVKSINDDLFIIDGTIVQYLEGIVSLIYDANPQLPRRVKVVAVRSEVPNAMSFGEGTIGITLGLLAKLKTDAQVAFVLSHEMAHFHASHSDMHLRTLARLNYDKELKKKIDDVKRSEYNRYSKMKEIFTGMGFSITQHSREHEHEADSLGFSYLINTKFNPQSALAVMAILDSVDFHADERSIDFKKHFDFKSYSFKPTWAVYTKSTTWHASFETADSLKTHPDCKRRIAALDRQWTRINKRSGEDNIGMGLQSVRPMSQFELVESLYHFKSYGKSLFLTLQLLNTYPANIYLQSMVGRNLYHLYVAQKNHEFGKYTELPDPRFSDAYDRYLTFIQKLRLSELSALSYYYTTYCPERNFDHDEFMYTLWLVSAVGESQIDPEKVKEEYLSKFPDGKFVAKMKPQQNTNKKRK
jgi:Zn-dependent protease with chaperone function